MKLRHEDNLPSTFNEDGSIFTDYIAADFVAQTGRAMMFKYLTDHDDSALSIMKKMLSQLITMQKTNGAFCPENSIIYNFHQAESLLFLGQYINIFCHKNYNFLEV
jgi:hypothetical protein